MLNSDRPQWSTSKHPLPHFLSSLQNRSLVWIHHAPRVERYVRHDPSDPTTRISLTVSSLRPAWLSSQLHVPQPSLLRFCLKLKSFFKSATEFSRESTTKKRISLHMSWIYLIFEETYFQGLLGQTFQNISRAFQKYLNTFQEHSDVCNYIKKFIGNLISKLEHILIFTAMK